MNKMRGFTLIELIVVLAVAAILIGWGIPGLNNLTANNRMLTVGNDLIGGFLKARNEAITRAENITIRANNNNWAQGWSIFVQATPATIIDNHQAFGGNVTMTAGATTSYTFNSSGRLLIANNETISFCDNRQGMTGRTITVSPIGRVSVAASACP